MNRRALTEDRARTLFAGATTWDFSGREERPDLARMRDKNYEDWDQMIATVQAAAWSEGYRTGSGDGFNRAQGRPARNPYRKVENDE